MHINNTNNVKTKKMNSYMNTMIKDMKKNKKK